MNQKLSIEVRGTRKVWHITTQGDQSFIDALRADGLEVYEIENTIPQWAVSLGLLRPWCLVQDAWKAIRLW